jgi:hypothetical protein
VAVAVLAELWWIENGRLKFGLKIVWIVTQPRILIGNGSGWVAVGSFERGDQRGSNGTRYNLWLWLGGSWLVL